MNPSTLRGIGTANATSAPMSSDEAPRSAHPIASSTCRYRPISGATVCNPSIETAKNSSSGRPMPALDAGDLVPVHAGCERLLLELLLDGGDLHARAALRAGPGPRPPAAPPPRRRGPRPWTSGRCGTPRTRARARR
jgi:hypothetical protein